MTGPLYILASIGAITVAALLVIFAIGALIDAVETFARRDRLKAQLPNDGTNEARIGAGHIINHGSASK